MEDISTLCLHILDLEVYITETTLEHKAMQGVRQFDADHWNLSKVYTSGYINISLYIIRHTCDSNKPAMFSRLMCVYNILILNYSAHRTYRHAYIVPIADIRS